MFEHMTLSVVKFIQEVVLLVPAHPLLRAKTLKPHNFINFVLKISHFHFISKIIININFQKNGENKYPLYQVINCSPEISVHRTDMGSTDLI